MTQAGTPNGPAVGERIPPPADPERAAVHPTAIIAIGCLCGIAVSLTQTMIVPLIPLLPSLLHTSSSNASWAVTATLLTAAVTLPISGRLGDMYGKRRMLLASLGALTAGSTLCALSDSLAWVVTGRALQGMSMGVIALGISIMRDELPAARVGTGVARMSATLGVGGAIGLPVAALVVEKADWHALFWIAAAVGVLCIGAVLAVVPESPVRSPARFDFAGAAGLGAGLISLLLVITKGGDWGWGSPVAMGMLAASVAAFGLWGWWEARVKAPLVDLRTTARPRVLFTNIASVGGGFAMYGMSLVPIQLLLAPEATGYGIGLTLIQAGLVLMPGGLMMYLFSGVGARVTAVRGPRASLAIGIGVMALGYLAIIAFRSQWWQISLASAITSAGVGVAYAAMPALIMSAVPVTETAAANGLNALMRSVGTSLSSAVVAAVLAHGQIRVGGVPLASRGAFTTALSISLGACAVALLLTLLIPSEHDPA